MDTVEQLIEARDNLDWSNYHDRASLTERIIQIYDAQKEIEKAFSERSRYMGMVKRAGYPDKMLVAFSWCVSQYDKDPQLAGYWHPLSEYKIILEYIPVTPAISKEQIIKVQEDFEKRLTEDGGSARTAYYFRAWNHMRMGDYDTAYDFQRKYISMPRGPLSDCSACERDRQVELLSRMHRHDECMDAAKPILSGNMTCAEVPEFTYAHVIRSLLHENDVKAAEKLYGKASRVSGDTNYIGTVGDLLLLLARTRKTKVGSDLISKNCFNAFNTTAKELQMRFYSGVACFADAMNSENRGDPVSVTLPREIPIWNQEGKYEPKELSEWFSVRSAEIAKQFDNRNGNSTYSEMLEENRQLAGVRG